METAAAEMAAVLETADETDGDAALEAGATAIARVLGSGAAGVPFQGTGYPVQ